MLFAQTLAALAVILGTAAAVLFLRPWWERLNRSVFAWMDRRLLTPFWVKLHPGERLEMVAKQSPIIVYEKLVIRGLISFFLGDVAGFFLAVVVSGYQFFNDPATSSFGFGQWIAEAAVVGLAVCAPVLLYTWFVEKWNQEHFRYVLTTSTAWAAAIRAPWGKPFISRGPTTGLREMFVSRDPKAPREVKKAWWQEAYEGWLWRWRGIDDVFLPSRLFGAADIWRRVKWAWGRLKILEHIRGRGEEFFRALGIAMSRFHNLQLDDALAEGGWVSMGDAQEVLAAHNRAVGDASPEKINLLTVDDPGHYKPEDWHKGLGEVGEVAAARPLELSLTDFPSFLE